MKSYGIVLFRNLTSLSFSSVSHNMSTSPYSICMKDELHLRNIFANLNIKCKNVCSQVSALPTIIVFRLKQPNPKSLPDRRGMGLKLASEGGWCQRSPVDVLNCQRLRSCFCRRDGFFCEKLRGAVRKPVKNGQNMSGGRWCFVFFRIGTCLNISQICIRPHWRWVMMKTTVKHHQLSESQVVFQTADLLRKLGIPIKTPKAGDHHRYGGFQFQSPFVNPLCQTCGSRIAMSHW